MEKVEKYITKNNQMKFYTMQEYCEAIKEYIEIYEAKFNSNFDAKNELKELINNSETDEKMYFLTIAEFVGKLTREINNEGEKYPFLDWIGKGVEETFTKNNFDEMMIKVCEI